MGLECGIFGLPNVGKSTCLNALSQVIIAAANNYPFCTITPNRSRVLVPDPRLEALAHLAKPERIVPTTVNFVDIAGLIAGASKGAGKGNQFLSDIQAADALIHVVRCFEDPEIMHVAGEVNPLKDIDTIEMELIFADFEKLEKRKKHYQKLVKSGNKPSSVTLELLEKAEKNLNQGILLYKVEWTQEEITQLKAEHFLTIKPMIYLANVSEEGFNNNPLLTAVQQKASNDNTQVIVSCVKLEAELIGTAEQEKEDLLNLLGCKATGLGQLIQAAYRLLGLQTFFTVGPQEVRAWTIPIGATSLDAAGCIHSDFQKGFIGANVIAYQDFIDYKGEEGAKAAGKLRLEKQPDYRVQEGDIMHFITGKRRESKK